MTHSVDTARRVIDAASRNIAMWSIACCAAFAHAAGIERGRAIAFDPARGDCTICHRLPGSDDRFHGTIGPPLAGVGDRLTPSELRARIVDPRALLPDTAMPAYGVAGGYRVVPDAAGRPLLRDSEIDDLVAWLTTLRTGAD